MGFLDNIRNRFIVQPVAEKILSSLSVEKSEQPNIYQVPYGFNQSNLSNNKQFSLGNQDPRTIRAVSVMHETTRAAINARKRQITQLDWQIINTKNKDNPNEKEQEAIKTAFNQIGGEGVRFRTLLNKLIEDTLVLDAFCYYKQKTAGGKLLKIIPIDPATIKLRVGEDGSIPKSPEPAFEQWIYGQKVAELTTDELTYQEMNPRSNSPYGLSPIESLMMIIDSSVRAGLYNSNWLNDNNIPAGFLAMPEGWTPQQIKEYKEWFDAMLTGSKNTSKVFPIPSGTNYQPTTKPSDFAFKDFFDYLDRKVCMLFDVTPQELGLNLQQYKENADGQEKIQVRKGIKPLANFIEENFTDIIQNEWGYTDYKFTFTGLDGALSPQDIDLFIKSGVISIDEAREELGKSKLGIDNFILTGTGAIFLKDIGKEVIEEQPKKEEPPIEEKPKDKQDLSEKMEKTKRNARLDIMEKSRKYMQFKMAIKSALEEQLKPYTDPEILDRYMNSEKMAKADIEVDDLDIEGYDEYMKWALSEGIKGALETLNLSTSFTFTSKRFQELLADRETYLITSVDDTTKGFLTSIISEAKSKGLTNEELADEIRDRIPEISDSRAETIARTEVAHAAQKGEFSEYKERGVEKKRWVTVEDIGDECGDNEAQGVIGMEEDFQSGDPFPPAHPNCRCYFEPVVDSLLEE